MNHMQINIHSRGVQLGPFPIEQVNQLLRSGGVTFQDMGWAPGMPEWKPLSEFAELQSARDSVPPPPANPPPFHPPASALSKTETLAIWSLVLGISSFLGPMLLTAIPAIICGHLGRSRIKKDLTLKGSGMAMSGLILGYLMICLIVAAIAIPNILK
jgi:Domain of unknown function (DUF4190)/GYF domain 2